VAIEVSSRKKTAQHISWGMIAFVIILICAASAGGGYWYLLQASDNLAEDIRETEEALLPTTEEHATEQYLLFRENQIANFAALLAEHHDLSYLFTFLEEKTHPEVWFSDFEFDAQKNDIMVSGTTVNFVALEQQMMILKTEPLIQTADLLELALAEGDVTFSLHLVVAAAVFEPPTEELETLEEPIL